jgi:hypothetical protein
MALREQIKEISPPWLQDGQAERYLFNIGDQQDAILEKVVQGSRMHMPTVCDETALPYIGRDRLIPRGTTETVESYRGTLQQAFEIHQMAGTPWAILRMALRPLLGLRPAARLVAATYDRSSYPAPITNSKWDSYAAGATPEDTQPTHVLVEPGNWDWDSVQYENCPGTSNWSRFWIIIESIGPNAWCQPHGETWDDDGTWDDPRCWDLDCDSAVTDSIWDAILLWKDQNAECAGLIISFDATHFDPAHAAGGGINPTGTYGRWSILSGLIQIAGRTSITSAAYGHRVQ